jgi:hypothetical protein
MTRGDVLAAIGLLAAPLYFLFYIPSVGWGEPGTAAYDAYQLANRGMAVLLVVVALTALTIARRTPHRRTAVVAFGGAVAMLVGSVAEFWIFSSESYASAVRGSAWSLFLLGALVFVLGGIALGIRRVSSIRAR